jgi:ubiquinone/menaquinone biosynthesis C-methylase UbiE
MFLHPDVILGECHLGKTDTVVDLGAGSGAFSRAAAAYVTSGTIFAIEVRRSMVETLSREIHHWKTPQVHALWGDIEVLGGTTLADNSADFVILSNTLFQLDDKKGCILEIKRILKRGGRVLLVDWSESYGGMGPAPHHVITKEKAQALFEQEGFTVLRDRLSAGSHHYGILFSYSS